MEALTARNADLVFTITSQVRDEILGLDINNLTPVEALNKLNDIKKIVTGKS